MTGETKTIDIGSENVPVARWTYLVMAVRGLKSIPVCLFEESAPALELLERLRVMPLAMPTVHVSWELLPIPLVTEVEVGEAITENFRRGILVGGKL